MLIGMPLVVLAAVLSYWGLRTKRKKSYAKGQRAFVTGEIVLVGADTQVNTGVDTGDFYEGLAKKGLPL